jgi:hypothetical protein
MTVRRVAEIVNRPERAVRLVAKSAGLTLPRNKTLPRQFCSLALQIPPPLMAELERAADRRELEPTALAVLILRGVISKGSISRAIIGTQV